MHNITKSKFIIVLIVSIVVSLVIFCLYLTKIGVSVRNTLEILGLKTICENCNVIMVTLDTLSANHLPCYGYDRNTAPNLCSFADKNILFENTYSNAPWTLPSHVSLFTGLFPYKAGVNDYFQELEDDKILLPQLLKSVGYNTLFFIPKDNPSLPVDQVYSKLGDSIYYNEEYPWTTSIEMFKNSVRDGKKTFMFLHTYDVHEPFMIGDAKQIYPPYSTKLPTNWDDYNKINWTPEFADYMVSEIKKGIDSNWAFEYSRDQAEVLFPELLKAAPDYDKELVVLNKIADTGMLWNYLADYQYNDLIDVNNPEDMKYMAALYDQTINILDNNKIPLLTNLINDPEFNDNTILVIFGDHGEEFMEHGHLYHETIYNSNIRVPLIMSIPGIYGEKIKENVQLVDVFPTLMKALGIKTDIPFDGKSLLGRIFGVDKSREVIVADGYQLKSKALIYDQWKLLLVQQEGGYMPYELYNIVDDPSESKNILYSNITVQNNILRLYSETVEK